MDICIIHHSAQINKERFIPQVEGNSKTKIQSTNPVLTNAWQDVEGVVDYGVDSSRDEADFRKGVGNRVDT